MFLFLGSPSLRSLHKDKQAKFNKNPLSRQDLATMGHSDASKSASVREKKRIIA